MKGLEIRVYNSFAECEEQLRDLNVRAQTANPFLHVDWLKLWWAHFGENKDLGILIFFSEDMAIGFAPFYLVYRKVVQLYHYRVLGDSFSSILDMVCVTGYEAMMIESLFRYFQAMSTPVILDLRDINDRFSTFFHPISEKLTDNQWISSVFDLYPCPLAVLEANWDDFFKKQRSGDSRNKLRRAEKWFKNIGELHFRKITSPDEMNILFPELHRLQGDRFSETEYSLFKGKRAIFFSDALKKMLNSAISLTIGEIEGTPIAFNVVFNMKDIFIGFAMAFDPAFTSLSLGHLQLINLMKMKIDNNYKYFDFSKGDSEYKRWWTNDETSNKLFRFGFNLNIASKMYYRLLNDILSLIILIRKRGYNKEIKRYIAKIHNFRKIPRQKTSVQFETLSLPVQISNLKLKKWTYRIIQELPLELRQAVIKFGIKNNLNRMRLNNNPEERSLIFVSEDGAQGYRFRY